MSIKSNKELKMSENLTYILGFGNLGTPELILILVVAVLLFGRRLPEVAQILAAALTNSKRDSMRQKMKKTR